MDILAEQAGVDPVTFRDSHLANNPRLAAVMHAADELPGLLRGVEEHQLEACAPALAAVTVLALSLGVLLGFGARDYVAGLMDRARSVGVGERVHLAMVSRGYTGTMPAVRPRPAATAAGWAAALAVPAVAALTAAGAAGGLT